MKLQLYRLTLLHLYRPVITLKKKKAKALAAVSPTATLIHLALESEVHKNKLELKSLTELGKK
jgi:hypothetical protein